MMMKNNKRKFEELAKTKIQDKRNIVISSFEDDNNRKGFTMAQQVEIEEGGKVFCMFMKESIHIDNLEGLIAIRDALNVAIDNYKEKVDKAKADEDLWDAEEI